MGRLKLKLKFQVSSSSTSSSCWNRCKMQCLVRSFSFSPDSQKFKNHYDSIKIGRFKIVFEMVMPEKNSLFLCSKLTDSFKYAIHRSMAQIQQLKFVAQIQNQAQILFLGLKSKIQG